MIGIVGSGPAALTAADVISRAGHPVSIYEKRPSPGRKLLIAGSSGLNITNDLPIEEFIKNYSGFTPEYWLELLTDFSPSAWLRFISELQIGTFLGTSGRYLIEEMKAAKFLQAWISKLQSQGVEFHYGQELTGFSFHPNSKRPQIELNHNTKLEFNAVCLALGGGSWEKQEIPLRWPEIFRRNSLEFEEFNSSNVGYRVAWSESFLKEAEGLPLKGIELKSSKGTRVGDAIVTAYGIEGTPVYAVATKSLVHLDLKPDLSPTQIIEKLQSVKENLSPIRRIQKKLNLCIAAQALLFHHSPKELFNQKDLGAWADTIKNFPLELLGPQPLSEAISSAGGLRTSELNNDLMIRKFPGFFAAGEMISWDAPTGGFLIQACVSQGYRAGQAIVNFKK